jgi:surface carbohydrate biosynthesis protein
MITKIINTIKKFHKIKFRFDLPKSKKILLFDEIHSLFLKKIIRRDFNTLFVRKKEMYFWIYLKQIIHFDFTFKTYSNNYIKYTSPKVIITFNDARLEIYELKKIFKEICFITIVNGIRFHTWFLDKKRSPQTFKCDYIFTVNKYYIREYQKIIDSNCIAIGLFRNNLVKIGKTKFHEQFLFISQLHLITPLGTVNEEKNFKKKLMININLYLSKKNQKLHILLRSNKNDLSYKYEVDFYKKYLNSNCIFYESSNWKKKYEIIDKFENIIFMYSSMGFEAIARKKKVAVFSPKKIGSDKYYFGWPKPELKIYSFFSTQNINHKTVAKVLKNVSNCSQTKWNKKYYSVIKEQCYFDEGNKLIKDTILNFSKT